MKIHIIVNTIFFSIVLSFCGNAQTLWTEGDKSTKGLQSKNLNQLPNKFRLLKLNESALENLLSNHSLKGKCLQIPLPNGAFECFEITATSAMHPDLAAKFPNIKTYAGRNPNNPTSIIRFVWSGNSFQATSFSDKGTIFIEKVTNGDLPFYISFFEKDLPKEPFSCETEDIESLDQDISLEKQNNQITPNWNFQNPNEKSSPHAVGTELRKYRLAMGMEGSVTQSLGGTAAGIARVASLTNSLNAILERDLCVTLELVANNDIIIFPDPATDPYSNNGLGSYLGENIAAVNTNIGVANFDIGHVINPSSGGVAYVGVVCNNSWKAGGTSPNNLGTFAHEVGHQMNAGHTFSYCGGPGSGDFEPGSGNTIMSYYGICSAYNMPGDDLLHYHASSYQEMVNHLVFGAGDICPVKTATGHNPPVITVPSSGFSIPISTPFTLRGTATDDSGSALTYLWEEYDNGPSSPPGYPVGNAPIFRSFAYNSDSTRTFPELERVINSTADMGETLPTYSRDLNFRFHVHDNHPGMGGADYGELMFQVTETAGPFKIEIPNDTNTAWSAGQTRTVTWDVANTNIAPVSCATVNILASFDGGFTYPDTLAIAVPNDGAQEITVPNTIGTQTRIKVEAADNVFFDISDDNFEIVPNTVEDFCLDVSPRSQSICSGNSVNYQFDIFALGSFNDSIHLVINNLPSGVTSNLPDSVGATSSTILTLSNLSSLAIGHYAMPFSAANADSSVIHSGTIYLVIRGTSNDTPGNSIIFDGNDHVSIPDIGGDYQFGKDQNFTVDFWLKTTTTSSDVIVAKKDWSSTIKVGWLAYIRSGKIRWVIADGSDRKIIEAPSIVNDGAWHHIAVVLKREANGIMQIFVDGKFDIEENIVNIGGVNNSLPIGIGGDSFDNYNFDGEIEEVRVWRKALTTTEIRENMHRISTTCSSDLISAWQFNESNNEVLDLISHYNGTLSGATRVPSTCPIGPGTSNSQIETNGLLVFPGTDFSSNYSNQDGASVTATQLNLAPTGIGGVVPTDTLLNDKYWIVNRYEKNGFFNTELTFNLNYDVTPIDEATPFGLKIYKRTFNSAANWTLLTNASSASAANNTVTFSNISDYGQYMISRSNGPEIGVNKANLDFCNASLGAPGEAKSYLVAGINLTNSLTISVTGNFEISLDSLTFNNLISLSATNGVITSTKIFVRTTAAASNSETGQIVHNSPGIVPYTMNLSAFTFGEVASNTLSGNGGDYLSLPRDPELIFGPAQDFTIELWIYTADNTQWPSIISNKDWDSGNNVGWGLFFLEDDWQVNINGTAGSRVDLTSNAPAINDGNWHHLAVVFDRDDMLTIYQDGILTNQTSMAGLNGLNIDAGYPINILQDGTGTSPYFMDAKIDELRLWNTTRTTQQIRENMHLTLNCSATGLAAYYQFNETTGDCLDVIGGHHGTLMNSATRIASDMPAAGGFSVSKNVTATQIYSFDDSGIDTNLDINFSGTLPNDEVVISYITRENAHGTLPQGTVIDHYWIANNYGNASALGDLTFNVIEDITPDDESIPFLYQIYGRNSNSFNAWNFLNTASTANAANNTLTFDQIPTKGQLLIVKDTLPNIYLTGNLNHFGAFEPGNTSAIQSYKVSASKLVGPLQVNAPASFEITLDTTTSFSTSLTINPSNGFITETTIYVRFSPQLVQLYADSISHTSTNATTKKMGIEGIGAGFGFTASNTLSGNSGDYMELPRNAPLIFGPSQDFTVELWIYINGGNADPSIIANKDWASGNNVGWGLFYLGNKWKVNINGVGGSRRDINSSEPNINDGKWHHLAAVFDRDDMLTIYQDGVLAGQISISNLNGLVIDAGFPTNVMQDGTGTYNTHLNAKIDELRLWNTKRTIQEIRENKHLTLAGDENGLAAYYQFNQTIGDCLEFVGGHTGSLKLNATRIPSDIPVAGGVSVTKNVTTAQTYTFDDNGTDTNLDINFSGTLPNGEVVVSNLTGELPHGTAPSVNTLSESYWIVNNYGTNSSGLDADMIFNTGSGWACNPDSSLYQMHKRASNSGSSDSWDAPIEAFNINTNTDEITMLGISSFSQFVLSKNIPACNLKLMPKALLQGNYAGSGLMTDDLRSQNLIPLTEPFTGLGFTHIGGGGETVNSTVFDITGDNAIIDWAFLELRDKNNNTTILKTKSALWQKDGDIVDLDGISPVSFANMSSDNYYLVIKHRNHLGVMSSNLISLSATTSNYDFTLNAANAEGGINGIADLGDSYFGLFSSDFDHNGQIQNTDVQSLLPSIGISGYQQGDLNLNGQVQNTDLQLQLLPNLGRGAQFNY